MPVFSCAADGDDDRLGGDVEAGCRARTSGDHVGALRHFQPVITWAGCLREEKPRRAERGSSRPGSRCGRYRQAVLHLDRDGVGDLGDVKERSVCQFGVKIGLRFPIGAASAAFSLRAETATRGGTDACAARLTGGGCCGPAPPPKPRTVHAAIVFVLVHPALPAGFVLSIAGGGRVRNTRTPGPLWRASSIVHPASTLLRGRARFGGLPSKSTPSASTSSAARLRRCRFLLWRRSQQ